jgi:hypothetical protein
MLRPFQADQITLHRLITMKHIHSVLCIKDRKRCLEIEIRLLVISTVLLHYYSVLVELSHGPKANQNYVRYAILSEVQAHRLYYF